MRTAALAFVVLLGTGFARADGLPAEKPNGKLVAAMAGFTRAMKAKDVTSLLKFFPRKGTWSWAPTRDPALNYGDLKPFEPVKHTYAELKAGLRKGGPFYEQIFEIEDSLHTVFTITKFEPWKVKPATESTFVPPGYGPPVYVRWRKEGARFVVDQIGTPES